MYQRILQKIQMKNLDYYNKNFSIRSTVPLKTRITNNSTKEINKI